MPDRKIEIEILAKGRPAEKGIDKVKKKTKDLELQTDSSSKKMSMSWAKVGVAVTGLTLAFKKLSDIYSVQLKAETALYNALRLNAQEGENTLEMWKDYASALQNVTLFGDEATLQQIAMLKTMQLSDEQTKKVIETAMDYATAFGKDMPSAVRELTMTLSGQIGTIKRTIPSIGDFTKEQLIAGDAIDKVSELMKGQAQALADTPWGKTEQLANSFGDEMERLGKVLLELSDESGAIGFLASSLQNVSANFSDLLYVVRLFKGELTQQERLSFIENQIKTLEEAQEKGIFEKFVDSIADQISPLNQSNLLLNQNVERLEKLKKAKADLIAQMEKEKEDNKIINVDLREREVIHIDLTKSYEDMKEANNKSVGQMILNSEEFGNALDILRDNTNNIARDISTAFTNMAFGIDTNFKDMTKSIIMNLVRIRMEALITQSIAGITNRLSVGRQFGINPFGEQAGMLAGQLFHTGGMVGVPSFHAGMRSDERLAKLQTGEAVINRAGVRNNKPAIDAMNAGYQVGGNGGNVTQAEINFNVQAIDAVSFNNYLVGNKQTIENIINNSLQTNGTVRRTIKQVI